jgi:hypothetical protein
MSTPNKDDDEVLVDNFPAPADMSDANTKTKSKFDIKPVNVDDVTTTTPMPSVNEAEMKKYFETMDEQRQRYIIKLAQQDKFDLRFVKDPSKPKRQWEYVFDSFNYYEVTVKEWNDIEIRRAELNDVIEYAAKRLITPGLPDSETWTYRRKIADVHISLYRACAKAFLGMSDDEYDRVDWDDVRNAIDACNHRTVYSLPNLAGTSVSFTG